MRRVWQENGRFIPVIFPIFTRDMEPTLLLQHIAKHIILTPEEQDFFVALLHQKKIRKKQFLNQEGDIAKGPVFVTEGILRSYSLDKNGFEHVIQFAPPGWWIGDMNSMVKQQPGHLVLRRPGRQRSTVALEVRPGPTLRHRP